MTPPGDAAKRTLELVPISDRMRYLQATRLASVAAVATYVPLASPSSVRLGGVLAVSAVYLAFAAVAQLTWRVSRAGGLHLFGLTLILDGLYLVGFAYASGWLASPLGYLVIVHLIAVALLASHRTGMKLALWDSLLLLVLYNAQQADLLPGAEGAAGVSFEHVAISSGVFMAVAAATASFSAVNERELRRQRYDLEALARMARSLEECEGSAAAADVLVTSVAGAYDFDRAVLLASRDDGPLNVLASHGEVLAEVAPSPMGKESVLAAAGQTREVQLVSQLDPAHDAWLDALLPRARRIAVFPLTMETRSIGALCVEHSMRRGSRIERRVVSTIERFVSHGALALHNAWLLERIQELAQTDGLTGVGNRKTFDARLRSELARAARRRESVSLMMVDVDRFKLLNDDHGHLTGDEVLRRVARQLVEASRESDSVARYGGEEFGLVLPSTDTEEALLVADRMRRLVAEADDTPAVTISAGIATFPQDGVEPLELVTAADVALYRSKRGGRDRVTAAAMPDDLPPGAVRLGLDHGTATIGLPREPYVVGQS